MSAAAMVNVLKAYPLKVVDLLTNESHSEALQLKHKFPPRLAEIKDAADAIMEGRAEKIAYRNRVEQQLAERAEHEKPKGDRPSYAELLAKFGPNFGLDPSGGDTRKVVEKPFKTMTVDELSAHYAANPDRITKLTGAAGTR